MYASAHPLDKENIDSSFKTIFQGAKKIWSGHEKLMDGQTDR